MKASVDLSHLADGGAEIEIRAKPGGRQNTVAVTDGKITVTVTAAAEGGKANAAIQKLLAKALGVAKTRLTLIRGATSRTKVFRID